MQYAAPFSFVLSFFIASSTWASSPTLAALSKSKITRSKKAHRAPGKARVPKIPKGMKACSDPMVMDRDISREAGETVRYRLRIDGVNVGSIDFQIAKNGSLAGQEVTEYRSLFKMDSLISAFLGFEGRAASLVPRNSTRPIQAMNRYQYSKYSFEENKEFSSDGMLVQSSRARNGKTREVSRAFLSPVQDFVSGYYMFRTLPEDASGCAIVYGNQRAYTIWVEAKGSEAVDTPVGRRDADRFDLVYASERSKKPYYASVWIGRGKHRLPYRATITDSKHAMEANVHLFETGSR